ncbi:uncharacterized protein IWZ02DRAFT_7883 [Phyllosticta citriasiana]|uniref:uncharacterized protein n=1 Tax=Phyllosticta citriasiana TaxID=595635 RepID=UPI0030FD2B2E
MSHPSPSSARGSRRDARPESASRLWPRNGRRCFDFFTASCVPRPWLGCFAPIECPGSRSRHGRHVETTQSDANQRLGLFSSMPASIFRPKVAGLPPTSLPHPASTPPSWESTPFPGGASAGSGASEPISPAYTSASDQQLCVTLCRPSNSGHGYRLFSNPPRDEAGRSLSSSSHVAFAFETDWRQSSPMTSPRSSARLVYLKPRPARLSRQTPQT